MIPEPRVGVGVRVVVVALDDGTTAVDVALAVMLSPSLVATGSSASCGDDPGTSSGSDSDRGPDLGIPNVEGHRSWWRKPADDVVNGGPGGGAATEAGICRSGRCATIVPVVYGRAERSGGSLCKPVLVKDAEEVVKAGTRRVGREWEDTAAATAAAAHEPPGRRAVLMVVRMDGDTRERGVGGGWLFR